MVLGEVGGRRGDLFGPSRGRPAEHLARERGEFVKKRRTESADEGEAGAAVDQIGEVLHLLLPDQEAHLVGAVAAEVAQWGVLRGEGVDDRRGARAVAVEQALCVLGADLRRVLRDPRGAVLGGARIVLAPADRERLGADPAAGTQSGEREVGHMRAERAEGRPLTADEAEQQPAAGQLSRLDAVVARDEARRVVVVAGERTDPREAVHDLRTVQHDARQHVVHQLEEVVDLLLRAHGRLARIRVDVGRSDHHPPLERVDQHDAAVVVLEEQLPAPGRLQQFGVVEHDMRALGAAHVAGGHAEGLVGHVGPWPRRVDHDLRAHGELVAADGVAQLHLGTGGAGPRHPGRLDVVRGAAVARRRPVEQHVEREAFWVVHRGVVVARGVLQGRVEPRHGCQGFPTAEEAVPGQRAAVA